MRSDGKRQAVNVAGKSHLYSNNNMKGSRDKRGDGKEKQAGKA